MDRLSSPDQLDQAMTVIPPLSWAGLAAGVLVLALALFWGIWGEIHTLVQGQGILLREGAVYDVVSLGSGQVKETLVEVDDMVAAGEVIARLSLPDLDHQLRQAREQLERLNAEQEMVWAMGDRTTALKLKTLANQRDVLETALETGRDQVAYLKQEWDRQRDLLGRNLSTRSRVQEAKSQYEAAMRKVMGYRGDLNDIDARQVELNAGMKRERFSLTHEISQARLKIRSLEETHQRQSRIVSPRTGRVLEIFKNTGKVIQTGEALASIEVAGRDQGPLSVFVYFPPGDGKKVKPGMGARITPSTVKMEEDGFLRGHIGQVSKFPASQKGMLRVLQNSDLVAALSSGGAPIAAAAELTLDADSPSGYAWASGRGPGTTVESGTLCTVGVVVKRQAPLELALPYLKRKVLGIGEETADE